MTDTKEIRGDRVSVEKDMHELFKKLTEGSRDNPEPAPFLTMKDVFMWAVALGVREGKRLPLGVKEGIFRWDQLAQDLDVPVLKAIAVAETGDVEALLREDQILRIAEEYANTGIREIREEVVDQPGQPLWNIVSMIRESLPDGTDSTGVLSNPT